MPPIPPIAPEVEDEAEESVETPEMEASETKIEVKCAAKDCIHNKGGYCAKSEINVSAGPSVKCESYETGGGGSSMKPPAPPMPFMGM